MAEEKLDSFKKRILLSSPCAFYLIAKGEKILSNFCGGYSLLEPQKIVACEKTLFDLASLTKPLVTALIALKSYSDGNFDLYEPIVGSKLTFTPIDLLRHEAGFPPWYPLYKFKDRDEAKNFLLKKVERIKPKTVSIYSCLGYILLGFILEEKLGESLDKLFIKLIREPLGIKEEDALFNPPILMRERIAGSELKGDYEKEIAEKEKATIPAIPEDGIWGVVHDGNARFLKGVAGNAGLFATVNGTYELLKCFFESSFFLDKKVLELCYKRGVAKEGEIRSVAFKMSSSPNWSIGKFLNKNSFAHEGFTGTFFSINREEEIMILLTNRIHPVHPRKSFSEERIMFIKAANEIFNS